MTSKILPNTKFFQHLPQHSTWYSIKSFLEINNTTIQLASFPFLLCPSLFVLQRPQNDEVVSRAEVLPEACLPLGFDTLLLRR